LPPIRDVPEEVATLTMDQIEVKEYVGGLVKSFERRLVGLLPLPVLAQSMPREDVVDVPAIGDGLCVSNIFQTNMVLQRDKPIHVWGWAEPGEQVTITFADGAASAEAGKDRAWKVTLPAAPANSKSQQMTVKGKGKTLVLDNILVGDVWVLGGQSNMEFELAKVENGPRTLGDRLRVRAPGPQGQQRAHRRHRRFARRDHRRDLDPAARAPRDGQRTDQGQAHAF
jgi:hypothetical protein